MTPREQVEDRKDSGQELPALCLTYYLFTNTFENYLVYITPGINNKIHTFIGGDVY
jgi:hypothetical protein